MVIPKCARGCWLPSRRSTFRGPCLPTLRPLCRRLELVCSLLDPRSSFGAPKSIILPQNLIDNLPHQRLARDVLELRLVHVAGNQGVVLAHPLDRQPRDLEPHAGRELLERARPRCLPDVFVADGAAPDLVEKQAVLAREARAEPLMEASDDPRERRPPSSRYPDPTPVGIATVRSPSSSSAMVPDETRCSRYYSISTSSPRRTAPTGRPLRMCGSSALPNAAWLAARDVALDRPECLICWSHRIYDPRRYHRVAQLSPQGSEAQRRSRRCARSR